MSTAAPLPASSAAPAPADSSTGAADRVAVVVRVRPLNDNERGDREAVRVERGCAVRALDAQSAGAHAASPSAARRHPPRAGSPSSRDEGVLFEYDAVFGAHASTAEVYASQPRAVAEAVAGGFNGCVFAYGQTSSGKTHTMRGGGGDDREPGVAGRAVRDVFARLAAEGGQRESLVRVSYCEVYREAMLDLLSPGNKALELREDKERGVFLDGCTERVVDHYEAVIELMDEGERNRHVGSTKMNARSSRSHSFLRLVVESRELAHGDGEDAAVRLSTLYLVDLAGSERAAKTGATGARLKEGAQINKSLVTLGLVISKLAKQKSKGTARDFIPYRDSKLTRILQGSLGGNSRTAVICAITPAARHADETRSTLRFAASCKRVTNRARVNESRNAESLLKQQAAEIAALREQLARAKGGGGEGDQGGETVQIVALRNRLLEETRVERVKLAAIKMVASFRAKRAIEKAKEEAEVAKEEAEVQSKAAEEKLVATRMMTGFRAKRAIEKAKEEAEVAKEEAEVQSKAAEEKLVATRMMAGFRAKRAIEEAKEEAEERLGRDLEAARHEVALAAKELEATKAELRAEADEALAEADDMRNEAGVARAETEAARSKVVELEAKLAELKFKQAELEAELEAKEASLSARLAAELGAKDAEMRDDFLRLREVIATRDLDVSQMAARCEAAVLEAGELKEGLAAKDGELAAKKDELRSERAALEAAMSSKAAEIAVMGAELSGAVERHARELDEARRACGRELDELRVERDELIASLQARVCVLESELAASQAALASERAALEASNTKETEETQMLEPLRLAFGADGRTAIPSPPRRAPMLLLRSVTMLAAAGMAVLAGAAPKRRGHGSGRHFKPTCGRQRGGDTPIVRVRQRSPSEPAGGGEVPAKVPAEAAEPAISTTNAAANSAAATEKRSGALPPPTVSWAHPGHSPRFT